MAVKRADQLVFYLGNFPFIIDFLIGRITLFFIYLFKNVINYVMREERFMPLHFAASIGSEYLCNHLLQNGANMNAKDKDGWTPLHTAVRSRFRIGIVVI